MGAKDDSPQTASSQEVARLAKQYPHFASRISAGPVTLWGAQIVERVKGQQVVSQAYRLSDGTIVPLSVD